MCSPLGRRACRWGAGTAGEHRGQPLRLLSITYPSALPEPRWLPAPVCPLQNLLAAHPRAKTGASTALRQLPQTSHLPPRLGRTRGMWLSRGQRVSPPRWDVRYRRDCVGSRQIYLKAEMESLMREAPTRRTEVPSR